MRKLVLKILAVSLAISVFIGVSLYALSHYSPTPHDIRPDGIADTPSDTKAGTLGNERLAQLLRDTRLYVSQHPDASPAMKAGKELAPAEFLNEQLEKRGEKFRVTKVKGLTVEMFNVS